MPDPAPAADAREDAAARLRPLRRVRQIRDFTPAPVDPALLAAIADVGRWSGSSRNGQPWRFIIVRDGPTIRRIAEAGLPQTRALHTATAAIATVLPAEGSDIALAYDDGRAAERMLVAASLLGLGGGITWVRSDVREAIGELLGLPADRFIRTILAVGHPTEAAGQPKAAPGQARLPRAETVFEDRWPG